MKIAFTTASSTLNGELDPKFGRAPGFLIYDTDQQNTQYLNNDLNSDSAQGAGIQAAQDVIAAGVQYLVTGSCGPKATQVLKSAGVKIFNSDSVTLNECLELLNSGKLTEA